MLSQVRILPGPPIIKFFLASDWYRIEKITMRSPRDFKFSIRKAQVEELPGLGKLVVDVYSKIPGLPKIDDQPDYYQMLLEAPKRVRNPAITIYVALKDSGQILGCIDFIDTMKHYGSGGSAHTIPDAAGIRLLAVKPECRGKGVGKELTLFCIERARELRKSKVILHTTKAMQTAWGMYEKLRFERFPEIDFQQGALEVYGFKRSLSSKI
ncbi:MAG: GNAT family N-acetyltransferase [Alphaproteobacteria bacterium]